MAITEKETIKLESSTLGEKTIILAKSGYGKSYTARVMIEEGRKLGSSFVIIDPQDAYLNMPEFSYIDARKVKSAKGLGQLLAYSNKNVVLMFKRLTLEEQNRFLKAFLQEFRRHIQKGIQTIIIDEAHKFAPESQKTESRELVRGMFQENRSDGLGCIAITQRISRLDKTIISQADNLAIGKVTSFRDKEAVKNYIDEPEDLNKIKNLEKGEFYLYGFGYQEPEIVNIRQSKTEHSGDSPKNLLTEDANMFNKEVKNYVRKDGVNKMDNVIDNTKKLIPTVSTFRSLAGLGMKMSIGGAVAGIAGNLLGARFKSPIPVVSSRTLGSALTTVALYAGYKVVPNERIKDVVKYATAGSAAFTTGSIIFNVLAAANVRLPNLVTFGLATATGASPISVEGTEAATGEAVDTNTKFA